MTGYSSKVATATWVGNVTGLTTQSNKSVNGRQVSTIRHAIWKSIMTKVNGKYGGDPFPEADPRFISPTMLTVPSVSTFEVESAKTALISGGLNVAVIKSAVPSSAPAGTVAYTLPAAGSTAVKGTIVKVYISRGGQVVVPKVAGLTIEGATAQLQALGFTVTLPQRSQTALLTKCDPTLPNGSAFGTLPEAGAPATPSSAIVLIPNTCG
jgi:membrane peptidoglycan carboxypeptidase